MGKGNRHVQWNSLFDEEQGETSNHGGNGYYRGHSSHSRGEEDEGDMDDDERQLEEILHLQNSDHPGMQPVSSQLTGSNFFNWSRSVRRALGAKSKLELLDGTVKEPDKNSKHYKKWIRADYMISSWIVNSISKELVDSFSHYETSKKLWDAICRRFDRSNGAKIAKLEKEIRNYSQGNQTVMEYFNCLTKLWTEMDVVLPSVNCVCHASALLEKREEDKRLVQFLLGLNDAYENSRSQILLMDPLPSLDRAYALIMQVEDEKSMNDMNGGGGVQMAMYAQKQVGFRGNSGVRQYGSYQEGNRMGMNDRRLSREEKRRLKCSNCKESGHEVHECFKLHGYPSGIESIRRKEVEQE